MLVSILQSWWTVVVAIIFVGIVFWAYSPSRKQEFEDAANIPFQDSDDTAPVSGIKEQRNV